MPGGGEPPHAGQRHHTSRSDRGHAICTGEFQPPDMIILNQLSVYLFALFIAVCGLCVLILPGKLNKERMRNCLNFGI